VVGERGVNRYYLHDPYKGWRWRRRLAQELVRLEHGEFLEIRKTHQETYHSIWEAVERAGLKKEDFYLRWCKKEGTVFVWQIYRR
jgi:hypothetical protein